MNNYILISADVLIEKRMPDINSRTFIRCSSVILAFPTVRRINTIVSAYADLLFFGVALSFPSLHEFLDMLARLLLTIPSTTAAASPSTNVFDASSARWCLSVDQAAF
ncbi:hypothetical protein HBH98_054360 [Parastagonospora nodorum]|nr:hypothetical protein HBH98_054360 [Parastagonospora nodorum]KAH4371066.1 hypothetical protein HBH99_236730 [Parastagonospora nodorum]